MHDHIVRVVSEDGLLRAAAVCTTALVREVSTRHQTDFTATVALGRLLTGGALMSCLLKDDQKLALIMEGNGPIGRMSVEADAEARVRGSIRNPVTNLPPRDGRFDVAGAIGKAGFLHVWKDLGLKEPYQSMVQLQSSEVAEDLAWFMTSSEQIPSSLGLGVELDQQGEVAIAGGFLVQSLPPGNEEQINAVIKRIEKMGPITQVLKQGVTPSQALLNLFADIPFSVEHEKPVSFFCPCNRAQISAMLSGLGVQELTELQQLDDDVEVVCEYCREKYYFDSDQIEALITEIQQSQGSTD